MFKQMMSLRGVAAFTAVILAAGILVFAITAVGEILRLPTTVVVDIDRPCSTEAARVGVERYLEEPVRRRQAARMLVRAGRLYDQRREPPSLYARTVDYYRASHAERNLSTTEMAQLLCAAPVIEIEGKRLAGIPSVAAEVLRADAGALSADDFYLISCAVVAAERGARRPIMDSNSAAEVRAALTEICD